jgi:hypothetical protein
MLNRTLVVALYAGLSVACGAATIDSVAVSPTTSSQAQERETVSGRFAVVYGDPPPDSGQPARRSYTLTDKEGRRWTLTFDEGVYSPPGGAVAFNGKDVEVEGRRTGTNRLLVLSMRLL